MYALLIYAIQCLLFVVLIYRLIKVMKGNCKNLLQLQLFTCVIYCYIHAGATNGVSRSHCALAFKSKDKFDSRINRIFRYYMEPSPDKITN